MSTRRTTAVNKIQAQMDSPLARLGQANLSLRNSNDTQIQEGLFFFLLFSHTISSIRSRRVLETVVWHHDTSTVLEPESGERMLYLTIERGVEWDQDQPAPAMPLTVWNVLTSEARRRNRAIFAAEERENRALYVRRRNALQAEHEHDLMIKQQRLRTAQQRGGTRILPAMQGQIDKAKSDHRVKLDELDQMQEARALLSQPLAACAVRVTL